ncbi:MAG TPA: CdaR family protein [Terriglobales bacterium]|jgi:YbbR domain-containing protein
MLDSPRNFFRKYVLKNLALKMASLAVAVLLWWVVGRDPTIAIPMTVPLEFHHAPDNLEMNSDDPLQAQITMRGPERVLRQINTSEVHAVIDMQGTGPGERTFDLTPKQIHVPRNVEVMQVVPAQFHISFDRSATRSVEVRPRIIGSLLSGYGITDVKADPAQVMIIGPEKRVDAIENVLTDPVDATGVVGKATFTTHAYVNDPLVRVQKPGPIHVTVTTGTPSKGKRQP